MHSVSDFAAPAGQGLKRLKLLELPGEEVGQRLRRLPAERTFAAVAGNEFLAAAEGVDGEVAVVAAQAAGDRFGGVAEALELLCRDERRLRQRQLPRVERGAVGAHQPGDGRAHHVTLYAILTDKKKVKGKTRLANMLKSGKELKVFAVHHLSLIHI